MVYGPILVFRLKGFKVHKSKTISRKVKRVWGKWTDNGEGTAESDNEFLSSTGIIVFVLKGRTRLVLDITKKVNGK